MIEKKEYIYNQEDILKKCEVNLDDLWTQLNNNTLYYGVFHKEHKCLIGVFTTRSVFHDSYVINTIKEDPRTSTTKLNYILSTESKYHKNYQCSGYGSEVKKSLFKHYQGLKLIPSSSDEINRTTFQGFSGLVHLRNKASLKYNIINCECKVGRFFGDRVEIYYPFVSTAKESHFGLFEDPTLHDLIVENLKIYLSRDADKESKLISEKALKKVSLENLMSVEQILLPKALVSESAFVLNTLGQFPELFESLSADQLNLINTLKSDATIYLAETPVKK